MFSKIRTSKSTENYLDNIEKLKNEIANADAILIGAGAGMSTAAGLTYDGKRFLRYFSDFHKKYGINDMYSGGFYPFDTAEEYWAWWSRQIWYNRYTADAGKPYTDLFNIIRDKDYFVLTTNVDHQFQKAGFEKKRLFYTQGDYGLWQCSEPCHQKTYDNESEVRQMISLQNDMKIPTELIPHCPVCGKPMTMNLRCDNSFVQDDGWYKAAHRYDEFNRKHEGRRILYLELGVGSNTPGIVKYPFWRFTAKNRKSVYACVNMRDAYAPEEIADRTICLDADIASVIKVL